MSRSPRPPHYPALRLRSMVGLLAAALALGGCAESAPPASSSPTASASASASNAGAAPTAEQTAWAGDVCTSTSALKSDLQGLVTASASGGDGAAAALKAQMTAIKESAAALTTTLKNVPAVNKNDPELAAVRKSAADFDTSIAALESSVAAFDGTTGTGRIAAIAAVASAAGNSVASLAAMVDAIATSAADTGSTIGQAFNAAPECAAQTKQR